jgi:hypothetical protein
VGKISRMEASKPMLANWSVLVLVLRFANLMKFWQKAARFACVMRVPFGLPVEPDVKVI